MSDVILGKTPDGAHPIYAGRCSSRRDIIALVAISARRSGTEWTPVRNPHRLFPKTGLVEIRSTETKSLRENDWVALQIMPNNGNPQVQYKGTHHWRLFNFLDLSHLGSIDEVRAALKIDGLPVSGQTGTWIIRTRQHEVIKGELVRSGNVMRLASTVWSLAVHPFAAESLIDMPDAEGRSIQLYDLSLEAAPTAVYDWAPDEEYISRVFKSLPIAYDARVDALVKSLLGHAENYAGRVALNPSDLLSAHEALRSGELAKALQANRDRLRELTEALKSSPANSRLIENEIEQIADRERETIQARLQSELQHEMVALRNRRLGEIDQELQNFENTQKANLEVRMRDDERTHQQALARRRSDEEQKLKQELGEQRAKLEFEIVREVEDQRDRAQQEVKELSQQSASLSESIAILENEETSLKGAISSLNEEVSIAERQLEDIESRRSKASAITSATLPRSVLPFAEPRRAEPLLCKDVHDAIQKCALLTPGGKKLMEQFVTLILAADVPILVGPQVGDFLYIAEAMFSSGGSALLVADPTIISVEDLWMRAGLHIPTALGSAISAHADDAAATMLAVVAGAENSAARYWYPALVEQTRRGRLPRNILFCVTLGDGDNDEARAIQKYGVTLDVKNAIDSGSPALAAVLLSPKLFRDLRPEPWIHDLSVGASLTITSIEGLTIDSAMRATRACLEANRLGRHPSAPFSSIASLFRTLKN